MDEEKINAIKYFIKDAPVGELRLVVQDIEALVGSAEQFQLPELKEALREYYEAHVSHHSLEDGTVVAVTKEGRCEDAEGEESTGDFKYIDEARGIVFNLNPTTGEVTLVSQSSENPNADAENLKKDLITELQAYVASDFKEGTTLPTVFVDGDSELTIRINMSCHNLNLQNYWGGQWVSTWDVMHQVGDDSF